MSHRPPGLIAATNGAHAAPFVRVRDAQLRHNPRMRPFSSFLLSAALLALAGCDSRTQADASHDAARAGGSAMEFRGERPCVDCNGIESSLRLEQSGNARHYRLVENYLGDDRQRQFEDEGQWLAEGDLLRLRSRGGFDRIYARQPDGSLQARDAHGRPLPAAADDVLVPVSFDSMR